MNRTVPEQLYDAMSRTDFPTFVARAMGTLEPGNLTRRTGTSI